MRLTFTIVQYPRVLGAFIRGFKLQVGPLGFYELISYPYPYLRLPVSDSARTRVDPHGNHRVRHSFREIPDRNVEQVRGEGNPF